MDMESKKISKLDVPLIPDHHPSSSTRRRQKRQLFMVVLIICFTLIIAAVISVFAVLKHKIDSESPAMNPSLAISSVCNCWHCCRQYRRYCFRTLSPLRNSSETNPTEIFTLAVRAAVGAFTELATLPESTFPSSSCGPLLNETLSRLRVASTALSVDSDAAVRNLTEWTLYMKGYDVKWCLNRLERWSDGTGNSSSWTAAAVMEGKMYESMMYASSSLAIIGQMNEISETFYPKFKTTVASFFTAGNDAFVVCFYGLQYLYLIVLFCIFFRLD